MNIETSNPLWFIAFQPPTLQPTSTIPPAVPRPQRSIARAQVQRVLCSVVKSTPSLFSWTFESIFDQNLWLFLWKLALCGTTSSLNQLEVIFTPKHHLCYPPVSSATENTPWMEVLVGKKYITIFLRWILWRIATQTTAPALFNAPTVIASSRHLDRDRDRDFLSAAALSAFSWMQPTTCYYLIRGMSPDMKFLCVYIYIMYIYQYNLYIDSYHLYMEINIILQIISYIYTYWIILYIFCIPQIPGFGRSLASDSSRAWRAWSLAADAQGSGN